MLSNLAACVSEHPSCKYSARHHWPCPHYHHVKPTRPQDLEADENAGSPNDVASAAAVSLVCAAAVAGTVAPRSGAERKPLLARFKEDIIDVETLAQSQQRRRASMLAQRSQRRRTRSPETLAPCFTQPCRFCGRAHSVSVLATPENDARATVEDVSALASRSAKLQFSSGASSQTHAITPTVSGKSSTFPGTAAGKSSTTLDDTPERTGVDATAIAPAAAAGGGAEALSRSSTSGRVIVKTRNDCRSQQQQQQQQQKSATAATVAETTASASTSASASLPVVLAVPPGPASRARVFRSAMYPRSHYTAVYDAAASASSKVKSTHTAPQKEPVVIITDKGNLVLPQHPLRLIVPSHLYPASTQRRANGTRGVLKVVVRWSARNASGGSDVTRIRAAQAAVQPRSAPAAGLRSPQEAAAMVGGDSAGDDNRGVSSGSEQPTALSSPGMQPTSGHLMMVRSVCTCCARCQAATEEGLGEPWSLVVPTGATNTVSSASLSMTGEEADSASDVSASHYRPVRVAPGLKPTGLVTSPTASVDGLGQHFGHSLSLSSSHNSPARTSELARRGQQQQQQPSQSQQPPPMSQGSNAFPPVSPEKQTTNMSLSTQGASATRDVTTNTTTVGLSGSEVGTPLSADLHCGSGLPPHTLAGNLTGSPTPLMLSSSYSSAVGGAGAHPSLYPPHTTPSQQELFKAIVQRRKSSLRTDPAAVAISASAATPIVSHVPTHGTVAESHLASNAATSHTTWSKGAQSLAPTSPNGANTSYSMSPNSVSPFFVTVPVPQQHESQVFRQTSLLSGHGGPALTTAATVGTASTTPEPSVYDTPVGQSVPASWAGQAGGGGGGGGATPSGYSAIGAAHAAGAAGRGGSTRHYPPRFSTPEDSALMASTGASAAAAAAGASLGSFQAPGTAVATYPWSQSPNASLSVPWVPGQSLQTEEAGAYPLGRLLVGMKPPSATVVTATPGYASFTSTPGALPLPVPEEDDSANGLWQQSRQSSDFWDHAVTPLLRPVDPNELSLGTQWRSYGMPTVMQGTGAHPGPQNLGMHHLTLPPPPGAATPAGSATPRFEPSPYGGPAGSPLGASFFSVPGVALPESTVVHSRPPSPAHTRARAASHSHGSTSTGPALATPSAHVADPTITIINAAGVPTSLVASRPSHAPTASHHFCRYQDVGHRRAAQTYAPTSAFCPGLLDRLAASRRLEAHRQHCADDHCYSLHNKGVVSAAPAAAAGQTATTTASRAPQTAAPVQSGGSTRVVVSDSTPQQQQQRRDEARRPPPSKPWYPFDDNYHRDGEMLEQLSLTTTSSCAYGAGLDGLSWRRWVSADVAASYDVYLNRVDDDDDDDVAGDASHDDDEDDDDDSGDIAAVDDASDKGKPLHLHSRSTSGHTTTTTTTATATSVPGPQGQFCACAHPLSPLPSSSHARSVASGDGSPSSLRDATECHHSHRHSSLKVRSRTHDTPLVDVLPGPTLTEALQADAAVAPRNWSDDDDDGSVNKKRDVVGSGKWPTAGSGSTAGATSAHQREASTSSGSGFRLFRSLRKGKKGSTSSVAGGGKDASSEPGVILHSESTPVDDADSAGRRSATRSREPVMVPGGPGGAAAPPSTNAVGFLPFTNWLFAHMEERRLRKEEKHARKQQAKEQARVELWRKGRAEQQQDARRRREDEAGVAASDKSSKKASVRTAPAGYRPGDAATASPCSPKDMLSDAGSQGGSDHASRGPAARGAPSPGHGRSGVDRSASGSGGDEDGSPAVFAHSFPGVFLEATNTAATNRARRALMTGAVMETFSDPEAPTERGESSGESDEDDVVADDPDAPPGSRRPTATAPATALSSPGTCVCARCHKPVRAAETTPSAPTPSTTTRRHGGLSTEDLPTERFLTGKPGGLYLKCRCKCLAPRRKGKFNIQAQAPLTVAQLERHKAFYAAEESIALMKRQAEKTNSDGLRRLVKDSKAVMSAEAAAVAAMWLHDATHGVPAAAVHHWYDDDEPSPTQQQQQQQQQQGPSPVEAAKMPTPTPALGSKTRRTAAPQWVGAAASKNGAASSTSATGDTPSSRTSESSHRAAKASHRQPDVFTAPESMPVRTAPSSPHAAGAREAADEAALEAANITLRRKRAAIESWLRHIE